MKTGSRNVKGSKQSLGTFAHKYLVSGTLFILTFFWVIKCRHGKQRHGKQEAKESTFGAPPARPHPIFKFINPINRSRYQEIVGECG